MQVHRILVINPGSTSTKIAVYRETKPRLVETIRHAPEELARFNHITEQYEFRKKIILNELEKSREKIEEITAVIGRGGMIKPVESGVYEVNEAMKKDLIKGVMGEHASNLGGLIADDIARSLPRARAFIADPVVVDELQDLARVAGHPLFERKSIFHALNHKAISRIYARQIGREYEDLNLIVAHLGGGITVGAHRKGRVVDVNQGLDGDGPFSPERSGTLPVGDLARLCFSGKYSLDHVKKMITGKGGLVAYLGTNDVYRINLMAEGGDKKAAFLLDALAYQVSKEIGAASVVLKGEVDAILITGGLAFNERIVDYIKVMVAHIARVVIFPGEDEMKALAMNALQVLRGEKECKIYQ
ncbi:MAG: butyrate kinase [Bacteroidales bacterium]|nr:butyrate kinase [Bacteroidales bacterium]